MGVVIDGVPPGMPLCEDDFIHDLERRKSGEIGTTLRRESDLPKIVSGVYDGCTTGAPLTLLFSNEDRDSSHYSIFREIPRPGHADYVGQVKYNFYNDIRGGGHFSGRLTLLLVAAGVVAKKVLPQEIKISSSIVEIGGIRDIDRWRDEIEKIVEEGDSLGGIVECVCHNVPIGLGEPMFDSMESQLSHLIFSIPAVRGVEFGDGFAAASMKGSEHNDPYIDREGHTSKNGAGGINGGITNGNPLCFRVAFKPTSSIKKVQRTFDFINECMVDFSVPGRHDGCIVLRSPVIVEAVAAIAIADNL